MSCDAVTLGLNVEDMDNYNGKEEARFTILKEKLGYKAALAATGGMALVASASATEVSINWTQIINLLDGVTTIFPSIGNMVIGIVPVIFVLIVVLFIVAFFDSIIGMIQGVMRIFNR